ncbi:MAG: glycosyltransferase family 39 protein, partial [Ignavibacteria bacterium]|nr:glycosyltransferase family 39 protein [Ignavibacteria bacterium]
CLEFAMRNKTIFYILAFCCIIRLYHIAFSVAGWHAWRQADTAAIAKNFYEEGRNILYPQIDWRGTTQGYVESEFHIYPFLISVVYSITGVNDSVGRILSVIFSLFLIYGIYILVRKFISENAGLWSALIYGIIPLNIYFNRAVMPETTFLMCSVYGIYFFSEWIDKEKWEYFIYAYLFVVFAVLIKIPCLYLGFPLMFLAYTKYKWKLFINWKILMLVVLIFIPVVLWYYHANQLLKETGLTFGVWDSKDKWSNLNIILSFKFYNDVFFKSIAERHFTYAAFIPFVIGLFIKRNNLRERLFDVWLLSIVLYILLLAKGNQVHEYYQLPFLLPAVVFAGKAFAKYFPVKITNFSSVENKNWLSYIFILFFVLTLVLSYLRISNFYKNEDLNSPLFKMSEEIKKSSDKNDLIITVCNGDPLFLYRADRKGWVVNPDKIDLNNIKAKQKEGAKLISGEKSVLESDEEKKNFEELKKQYKVIADNEDYFILKLN